MKKLTTILMVMVMSLGVAGLAGAASYYDLYDAGATGTISDPLYMQAGDTDIWTFDITDPATSSEGIGFDSNAESIYTANIKLYFTDDLDYSNWWLCDLEIGLMSVDYDDWYLFNIEDGVNDISLDALASLNEDGLLDISLSLLWGDVYFLGAELYADSDNTAAAPVPEPATMLLMGAGLIGLAGVRRKKKISN